MNHDPEAIYDCASDIESNEWMHGIDVDAIVKLSSEMQRD
jgi:hypothetical protein